MQFPTQFTERSIFQRLNATMTINELCACSCAATWKWETGINKQRLPAFRTNPAKSLCEISKHIKSLNIETYEWCDCVKKKKKRRRRKKHGKSWMLDSCFYKLFPVALSRFNGYGSNTRSSFIRVNSRIHNGG